MYGISHERTDSVELSENDTKLLRLKELPYAKSEGKGEGTIVGCTRCDDGRLYCDQCDIIHQHCPKGRDRSDWPESVKNVIRTVYPCPKCDSRATERAVNGPRLWECHDCGYVFHPDELEFPNSESEEIPMDAKKDELRRANYESGIGIEQIDLSDDGDDDGDDDGEQITARINDEGKRVLEGKGYDLYTDLQSSIGRNGAYGYHPEDDTWSITLMN